MSVFYFFFIYLQYPACFQCQSVTVMYCACHTPISNSYFFTSNSEFWLLSQNKIRQKKLLDFIFFSGPNPLPYFTGCDVWEYYICATKCRYDSLISFPHKDVLPHEHHLDNACNKKCDWIHLLCGIPLLSPPPPQRLSHRAAGLDLGGNRKLPKGSSAAQILAK